MALIRSIATVSGFTLLSRVLGFARDVLMAAILGAGPAADAFFVAFKVPNLFRRLFAEGAFAAAFVPLYSGFLVAEGRAKAQRFAEESLAVLLAALFIFVAAVVIAMPWVMTVIAPGFVDEPIRFGLAVELARITFPYLLFISLVALMGAVLNAHDRFAAAASAPILLNMALIAALLSWNIFARTPAVALAWGVAAAGLAQFTWLGFAVHRAGFALRLRLPRLTPEVRRLLRLMLPVAIGAGVYQINVLVDLVIGSLLPPGAISYLYYADRVNQLPLGVFGIAVATALLPLLSRQIRAEDDTAALASQNRALEFALLLTVPAALALIAAAWPITAVLFGRGAFGPDAQAATALALSAYALGLPAYVIVKVLATGYFAREDTATPVKIGALALVVNVVLNLALMGPLGHVGIAIATSVSAWINAGLLALGLARRGRFVADAEFRRKLPRIIGAAAVMATAIAWAAWQAQDVFAGPETQRVPALAALVVGGVVLYGVLVQIVGAARMADLRSALGRKDNDAKEVSSGP
jgi:putative peptidoglycan lipid II flippase